MTESTNTRAPRTLASREVAQRQQWSPPCSLPEPTPDEQYVYRWVRAAMGGAADGTNLSQRFREGFVPCRAEDHPELSIHAVTDPHSKFVGQIESGGLLLCKIPKEFVEQRNAYYSNQTTQQMTAVDATMDRENDPRMPMFRERKTKVTFGTGN